MKILDFKRRKDTKDSSPPLVRQEDVDAVQSDESKITADLEALTRELEKLNNHRFIQLHNSPVKLIMFQIFRGLAFGFGSVAGATIIVSIVAYILNQMDFVPYVGEWAKGVASEIMSQTQRVETGE